MISEEVQNRAGLAQGRGLAPALWRTSKVASPSPILQATLTELQEHWQAECGTQGRVSAEGRVEGSSVWVASAMDTVLWDEE